MTVKELKNALKDIPDDIDADICVRQLVNPDIPLPYMYNIKSARVVGPSGISDVHFMLETAEGFEY